jgi:putative endonuclease
MIIHPISGSFHMYQLHKGSLGARGEDWAKTYLLRKNYTILTTNYVNPLGRRLGEIDIVAKEEDQIVFIEVKTRLNEPGTIILPEENITRAKLHKLTKIAEHYLRSINQLNASYRFDALSLLYSPLERKVSVRHLKDIFYS